MNRHFYCKTLFIIILLVNFSSLLCAQSGTVAIENIDTIRYFKSIADSSIGKAHQGFDGVSKFHRLLFGENYRKEWSAETQLPMIRISEFDGGLVPEQLGGGNQTHSLRLKDKKGNEWVIRSVVKYPETILPQQLKNTFVKDILTDAMSAQHPYSALIVPPIANAVGVPHANPIIGIIAPDAVLGKYSKAFAGTICLIEEREPGGKSDNYSDMLEKLNSDNDNSFDSSVFLKARILDVFLGDWDRHKDQWRFRAEKYGNGLRFTAIPRDRDQVFYTNQGVFPYIESRPYVQPFFEGFNPRIRNVGTFLFTSTLMNARLLNQFSYDEWMKVVNEFVLEVTDSVLNVAIDRLPRSSYNLRHEDLTRILKSRRADLPRAMSEYYYFLNRTVFIQTTNKNELVEVKDTFANAMQVNIYKLSNNREIMQTIFSKTYFSENTREIRFFIGMGNDSILINNHKTPIKLRFSGGDGDKNYKLIKSNKKVAVFENKINARFYGDTARFKKRLSNDSLNTAINPGGLFNVFTPLLNVGYNLDDGVLIGFTGRFTKGIDYTTSAFSTKKYNSFQQFGFTHSFDTRAINAKYNAHWVRLIGKADLLLNASVFAPNNTQNYFGVGNQTSFIKSGDYKKYYRSRFSLYQLNSSLRWHNKNGNSISIGPAFEYYTFDSSDNVGRYIESPGAVQSYDSVTLSKSKIHGGLVLEFNRNRKDDELLPSRGYNLNILLQGLVGLNTYSKSYAQLVADFAVFLDIGETKRFVLADRIGGGITTGNAAFYQSMFLGGQSNLLGYRQYRFAGQYMAFNNLEARVRVAQFANYILPGQLGLIALFDFGRVWQKEDHSNQWHNGIGGGLYFAPAQIALFEILWSYSTEGWYPVVKIGFRF